MNNLLATLAATHLQPSPLESKHEPLPWVADLAEADKLTRTARVLCTGGGPLIYGTLTLTSMLLMFEHEVFAVLFEFLIYNL